MIAKNNKCRTASILFFSLIFWQLWVLLIPVRPILADGPGGPDCGWPFYQPTVSSDQVDNVIIGVADLDPTDNKFRMRIDWDNFVPDTHITAYNVGDFTGYTNPSYQRGHKNEYPDSAIQIAQAQKTVGMWLNSLEPDPTLPVRPAGYTMVSINMGCWWDDDLDNNGISDNGKVAFSNSTQGIKVSFNLKIPKAYAQDNVRTAGQGLFQFVFQETKSGDVFFYQIQFFDTRSSLANNSHIFADIATTNLHILSTSIDREGWHHKGSNSAGFKSTQFSNEEYYEFSISSAEFIKAIQDFKAHPSTGTQYNHLSEDAQDYQIINFSVGPELSDADIDGTIEFAQIGMSINDLKIEPYIYCNGDLATIIGSEGPDNLTGTSSNDVIVGLGGNDIIDGAGGNDIICGGEGNDQIFGSGGDDAIYGNQGNDIIEGNMGSDYIHGGQHNDNILGGAGADDLHGGLGDDTIYGNENNDHIEGGEGGDYIHGGQHNDTIYGGEGTDELYGGVGDDEIYGNQANDLIYGGDGNDTLRGGQDDDTIFGEEGDDNIDGNLGNNTIDGGPGNNIIYPLVSPPEEQYFFGKIIPDPLLLHTGKINFTVYDNEWYDLTISGSFGVSGFACFYTSRTNEGVTFPIIDNELLLDDVLLYFNGLRTSLTEASGTLTMRNSSNGCNPGAEWEASTNEPNFFTSDARGASGSKITFYGGGFSPYSIMALSANGQEVGLTSTDSSGQFTFQMQTSELSKPGTYVFTASTADGNSQAQTSTQTIITDGVHLSEQETSTSIQLENSADLIPGNNEFDGVTLHLTSDIQPAQLIFLPLIIKLSQ